MSKLYFKYGVVNSSKSANALMTIHNYEEQGMKVFIIKPIIDTRDTGVIKSRAINNSKDANLIVSRDDDLVKAFRYNCLNKYDVVLVDECQFLASKQVDQLRQIANEYNTPVLCYGLRTDFKTKLFEGSKRLFELADSITEIKTVCKCGSKAIFNARLNLAGDMVFSGEQVKIGGNDLYRSVCSKCYFEKLTEHFNVSRVQEEVYKSFIENKTYISNLVSKLEDTKVKDRGIYLNEVICVHYYIERLISKCESLDLLNELESIQSYLGAILESATAHDLLVAQKRANNRG